MKPIGQVFLEGTYYEQISEPPQDLGVPQPPLELPLPEGAELIPLPKPDELMIPPIDLRQAIEQRRSSRRYKNEPVTLEELSYLLWLTQGVKEITGRPATLRTVPSAGSRHAFETYLMIRNVTGLKPGLYRFAAIDHALIALDTSPEILEELVHGCWDQKQVAASAVTFFWVAVLARMAWRYVERGYRYLLLDAGHVCQNLYLAAEAVQCGVCAIGAYNDERLNASMGLDGKDLFVIYLASLGKK